MSAPLRRSTRLKEKAKKLNPSVPKETSSGEEKLPKTLLGMAARQLSDWEDEKNKAAVRFLTVPCLLANELDKRTDMFDADGLQNHLPQCPGNDKKKEKSPMKSMGVEDDWRPKRYPLRRKLLPSELCGVLKNIVGDELKKEFGLEEQPEYDDDRWDDAVPPLHINDICPEQKECPAEEPLSSSTEPSSSLGAASKPKRRLSILSSYRRDCDDEDGPVQVPDATRFEEVFEQPAVDVDPKEKPAPLPSLPCPLPALTTIRPQKEPRSHPERCSSRSSDFPILWSPDPSSRRSSDPSTSRAGQIPEVDGDSSMIPELGISNPSTYRPHLPRRFRFKTLEPIYQRMEQEAAVAAGDLKMPKESPPVTSISIAAPVGSSNSIPTSVNHEILVEQPTPRSSTSDQSVLLGTPKCLRRTSTSVRHLKTPVFANFSGPLHLSDVPVNENVGPKTDSDTNNRLSSMTSTSLSLESTQRSDSEDPTTDRLHSEVVPAAVSPHRTQDPRIPSDALPATGIPPPSARGASTIADLPISSASAPATSSTGAPDTLVPTTPSSDPIVAQILRNAAAPSVPTTLIDPCESRLLSKILPPRKRPHLGDQTNGSTKKVFGNECFCVINSNASQQNAAKPEYLLQLLASFGFGGISESDFSLLPSASTLLQGCHLRNIVFRANSAQLNCRLRNFLDHSGDVQQMSDRKFGVFGDDDDKRMYLTQYSCLDVSVTSQVLFLVYGEIQKQLGKTVNYTPNFLEVVTGDGMPQKLTFEALCHSQEHQPILKQVFEKMSKQGKNLMKNCVKKTGVEWSILQ